MNMSHVVFRITASVLVATFLFGGKAHAGGFANDAEQKCLELTRIAANSMRLTPADEEWCQIFGRTLERGAGVQEESDHGKPSPMPCAELLALINKFIALNPTYAKEPLAAQTMYAVTAFVSGEWHWSVNPH